jgi:hypothetical protein
MKNGGSAFPFGREINWINEFHSRSTENVYNQGMTLRDYFAGQALTGMLAHSRNEHGYQSRDIAQHWHQAITQEAYQLADAMLEQREK